MIPDAYRRLAVASLVLVPLVAACGRERPPKLAVENESAAPRAAVVETVRDEPPHVVAFDPPQGATDVDPARTSISATFDRAMDPDGWAWVIENPATAPEIGESHWDEELRTNTAHVALEPGRTYVVWVNSPQFPYFKDPAGRVATPVRWTFTTRGTATANAAIGPVAAHAPSPRADAPRVVALDPADGAAGVDPATSVLRARFDRPMEPSWAWVTEGRESFPPTTGEAYFESDGVTAALPVALEPNRTYVVWLNSEQHQLFRDRSGTPLAPVRWSFTTGPAR